MTRYELLDRIGVGGMAEIFRGKAVAAGGFEKPVAIKRILPHLSQDQRFVQLLIAEAKVLSQLKHRNIVQIFDVGLGDDSKYFLVMEYVDGKDLGAVQRGLETKRKRMPLDLVLSVGAEICDALEHAHTARGPDGKPMMLVHRDVSPTNVLVSRAGEIKLTDFGIAKRAEESTGHGSVRGKFAYISPEQARNEHLNARSDLFAVGLLLWELVTGRRLFSALSDLEALRSVREAKVPTPTSVDPRLPREVDDVLMMALAADPAARYPSAGQFGAKLRSLRYSLEVTTGDPATELGKLVEIAEQVQRERERAPVRVGVSRVNAFPVEMTSEATVIRIHTADAFAIADDDGSGLVNARAVIDRFDEEETRLAQLSGNQLQQLRRPARDSSSSLAPPPPPAAPPPPVAPVAIESRTAGEDDPTTARPPLDMLEASDTLPPESDIRDTPVQPQTAMGDADEPADPSRQRSGLAVFGMVRPVTLPGVQPTTTPGQTPAPRPSFQSPVQALARAQQPVAPAAAHVQPQQQQPQPSQQPQPQQPQPQQPPFPQPLPQPPVQPQPFAQPPPWQPQPPPPAWQPQPQPYSAPPSPQPPVWHDPTPQPVSGVSPAPWQRPNLPTPPMSAGPVAHAAHAAAPAPRDGLPTWLLLVGAVVVAAVAFAITRLVLAH